MFVWHTVDRPPSSCLAHEFSTTSSAAAVAGGASSGGTGVLVLMAILPVFHLLSLAALDALSHLRFLKVRRAPFQWYYRVDSRTPGTVYSRDEADMCLTRNQEFCADFSQ